MQYNLIEKHIKICKTMQSTSEVDLSTYIRLLTAKYYR